uniref:transposase n=1 Tax=Streptomyces sp. CHD11 TaxID=2741325 RepID=UPI00203B8425|nr:transposase [Streptomyces sp. CHD11]
MSDAEWAVVRDLLPVPERLAGRGGRPEGYCHRQMLDAIRYLVDNGIKWRSMPSDFPPWPRVYAFFTRWRDTGLVAELHDRLRETVRVAEGRDQEPSAAVIDSQSVKADATVTHGSRGFDAGKKVNGRKRHLRHPASRPCRGLTAPPGLSLDATAPALCPARSRKGGPAHVPPARQPRRPRPSGASAPGSPRRDPERTAASLDEHRPAWILALRPRLSAAARTGAVRDRGACAG